MSTRNKRVSIQEVLVRPVRSPLSDVALRSGAKVRSARREKGPDHPATLSIEIWVAGRTVEEALARRKAVEHLMERPSVTHVGSGCGHLFQDLRWEGTGKDPLFAHGDVTADAEFHCTAPTLTDLELEVLADTITEDLEHKLGFKVAVGLTWTEAEGEIAADDEDEPIIDPDALGPVRLNAGT